MTQCHLSVASPQSDISGHGLTHVRLGHEERSVNIPEHQLLQVVVSVSLLSQQCQPLLAGVGLGQDSAGKDEGVGHELAAAAPLQHQGLIVKVISQPLLLLPLHVLSLPPQARTESKKVETLLTCPASYLTAARDSEGFRAVSISEAASRHALLPTAGPDISEVTVLSYVLVLVLLLVLVLVLYSLDQTIIQRPVTVSSMYHYCNYVVSIPSLPTFTI